MIMWRLVTRELGRDVATGKEDRATYKVGTSTGLAPIRDKGRRGVPMRFAA